MMIVMIHDSDDDHKYINISLFVYIIPVLFNVSFDLSINWLNVIVSIIVGLKLYKHLSGFPLPQNIQYNE